MAASMRLKTLFSIFLLNIFYLFLSFAVVNSNDNSTNTLNVSVFGEEANSYFDLFNTSTPPPTVTDLRTTVVPVLPTASSAEPLPVSGRLPTPVTDINSVCPCDEDKERCDMNCCCDGQCEEQQVALFTTCSVQTLRSNTQLCSQEVASYSLRTSVSGHSELQAAVQQESNSDVFCVHSQNRADGFSHPPPALPTDGNFKSLYQRFSSFVFGPEGNDGERSESEGGTVSGYQYGDVMATVGEAGLTGLLLFPAAAVTAQCVDSNPAGFLVDESSSCSRQVSLSHDCSAQSAISMDTYTTVQLLAGKTAGATVVGVTVESVVLQALDGTQTQLQLEAEENRSPVLLNSTFCTNAVLKVFYVIKYNPAGEIVNVTLSLVLGFVHAALLPLQQEFHITFVQDDKVTVHFSGNPGYVVGLPLVSGMRTADGLTRSVEPSDTLSLLHTAGDQDCLQGPHQRSPVLFGVDSVCGCTLRLQDAANCSLLFHTLLPVLRGAAHPQYVASFGNAPLDSLQEWVPVQSNFKPGDTQSCSVPLALHVDIEWTQYGPLTNPQARIVSVKETILSSATSLASVSPGSGVLSIHSSVTFTAVSAAAAPAYRAMPTIDAKLSSDFFFPFV
ncbi:tectonic-1-like [Nelusetta ayraudi]|uniref:tectonic-1-like n=1 Tax=Nelusetta ayraudi TaxID=303726 RepID=UPI003F72894D